MKTPALTFLFFVFIFSASAKKKIYYGTDLGYTSKNGCCYAYQSQKDNQIILEFYDCRKVKICKRTYNATFNYKSMHAGTDCLEGEEIYFNPDGSVECKGINKNGKRQEGIWKKLLHNGYISYKEYASTHLKQHVVLHANGDSSSIYYYETKGGHDLLAFTRHFGEAQSHEKRPFKAHYRDSALNFKSDTSQRSTRLNDSNQVKFYSGDEGLLNFLIQHLRYPKPERSKGISGVVMVVFIVSREGVLLDLFTPAYHGMNGLVNESIRVLQLSDGLWNPGRVKGKAVNTICRIPITFEIDDGS